MQPLTIPAATNALTLDETIARLAAREAVDGILLMGSTGTGTLNFWSDYDLLLVLTEMHLPLGIVTTWVDGRLTEVYCTTTRALEQNVANPDTAADAGEVGAIIHWLRTGHIAHDRAGRLARAQTAAREAPVLEVVDDREVYATWRKIGYNVAHAKRYLSSDDPLTQEAVDLRLLYSLMEVVTGYFTVRRVSWRGEKPALQYLAIHDPGYLDLLRRCLAEHDRRRKVQQYEELARLTLAPVGELWAAGTTVGAPGSGYGVAPTAPPGTLRDALTFWRSLLGDEEYGPRAGGAESGR